MISVRLKNIFLKIIMIITLLLVLIIVLLIMIIMVSSGNTWILNIFDRKERRNQIPNQDSFSRRSPTPQRKFASPTPKNANKFNSFHIISTPLYSHSPKIQAHSNSGPKKFVPINSNTDNSTRFPPSLFSMSPNTPVQKNFQSAADQSYRSENKMQDYYQSSNNKYRFKIIQDENTPQNCYNNDVLDNLDKIPVFKPSKKPNKYDYHDNSRIQRLYENYYQFQ